MKFKWKLFLSYLLIVLVPFLAAERYISSHLEDRLLEQIEDRLSQNALLIKAILEREYVDRAPSYEMDALIKEIGRNVDARISFIDRHGTVLADTEIIPEKVPDMVSAFRGQQPG